jgi:spore germination protein GerM
VRNLRTLTVRQWLTIVAIALVAVVLSVLLFTGLSRLLNTPAPAPPDGPAIAETPSAPAAVPKIKATLYFASEDGMRLVPAEQEVPLAEGVVAQARSIIEAQLAAAAPAPLVSTIPQGAKLRGLYVSDRNEAFVDLDATIRTAHPGGTLQELMTVYTIVNALLTNLPDLQQVQILIDGQEVDTLAGHVDLRRPLRKNEALILSSVTPTPPPTQ